MKNDNCVIRHRYNITNNSLLKEIADSVKRGVIPRAIKTARQDVIVKCFNYIERGVLEKNAILIEVMEVI